MFAEVLRSAEFRGSFHTIVFAILEVQQSDTGNVAGFVRACGPNGLCAGRAGSVLLSSAAAPSSAQGGSSGQGSGQSSGTGGGYSEGGSKHGSPLLADGMQAPPPTVPVASSESAGSSEAQPMDVS